MDTSFCLDALEDALGKGRPEVFNTHQGQFTSAAFTDMLEVPGCGSAWTAADAGWTTSSSRACRAAEVRGGPSEGLCRWSRAAIIGIGQWFGFYNERQPHQASGYKTRAVARPAEVDPVDLALR
jgi:putative transposase